MVRKRRGRLGLLCFRYLDISAFARRTAVFGGGENGAGGVPSDPVMFWYSCHAALSGDFGDNSNPGCGDRKQ